MLGSKLDLKLELCCSSSWEASWSDLGMVLEGSWGCRRASWGRLGGVLGVLGCLGGVYGESWGVLVAFGKGLELFLKPLGVSWDVLIRSKTH